ncbi:hypothetical protein KFV02_00335 [Desulfohalobiaceae bacterium Ax17]|uniref:hypothetical protein n=1 Tax=Desulfovulcanus ferrireducens TaxID=2831190 RepID=UPI00207BC984|nr:hypothetical protein [Desulfovulcanus ferrireducens]MBT8762378.1 hypothetical protein [Desulfovulcanus ferrireducens]
MVWNRNNKQGQGQGCCSGGQGKGMGRGQGKKGQGMGKCCTSPGAVCVCPQCGAEAQHQTGVPCVDTKCPSCGAPMTRKF